MPGPLVGVGLNALARIAPQVIRVGGAQAGRQAIGGGLGRTLTRVASTLGLGGVAGAGFDLATNLVPGGMGGGGGDVVSGPVSSIEAGMVFPDGKVVGKAWSTNGSFNNMGMTMDRKYGIALRNDGTVKTFRYQKHIVIPRNPRMGDYVKASRRLDTITRSVARRSKDLAIQRPRSRK